MKKSKQKNRRLKRYLRKQIKKALLEKELKNQMLNLTDYRRCNIDGNRIRGYCNFLAMPDYVFDNEKCRDCIFKPKKNLNQGLHYIS